MDCRCATSASAPRAEIETFGGYGGGYSLLSTTTLNPDLVGEIRLILSPVDAELGRGNSQVQITTRSGTNRYTGSAVWNIQNTALNANTWDNNNDVDAATGKWSPTQPPLEKHAPVHRQLRRADSPQQDVLLRAVGPADNQPARSSEQPGPD